MEELNEAACAAEPTSLGTVSAATSFTGASVPPVGGAAIDETWKAWVRQQAYHRDDIVEHPDGSFKKVRARFPNNPINPADVHTDGAGNITKMPEVVTRPCFGDIITYYLDGERPKVGTYAEYTKCRHCKAKEACADITAERIAASPAIDAALARCEYRPAMFLREGARFNELVAAIIARGRFASSNDAFMAEHRARQEEENKKRALAARKKKRADLRAKGIMDPLYEAEAHELRDQLLGALLAASGPGKNAAPKLRHLKPQDCEMIVDVWLGRTILSFFTCNDPNANAVGSWLIENGRARGKNRNGAYKRVQVDLRRIAEFEDSGGIWHRLIPWLTRDEDYDA